MKHLRRGLIFNKQSSQAFLPKKKKRKKRKKKRKKKKRKKKIEKEKKRKVSCYDELRCKRSEDVS